jgi:hypothetical protein
MSNNFNVLPVPPSELPNSSTDEFVDDFVNDSTNDSTNDCTYDFVDEVIYHTGCKLANLIFQDKFVKKSSNKTGTNVGAANTANIYIEHYKKIKNNCDAFLTLYSSANANKPIYTKKIWQELFLFHMNNLAPYLKLKNFLVDGLDQETYLKNCMENMQRKSLELPTKLWLK